MNKSRLLAASEVRLQFNIELFWHIRIIRVLPTLGGGARHSRKKNNNFKLT
jgi:hypothetical protein